ncbi:hypothetical protein ACFOSC_27740 [Streptantibioticus rubrisoli]|uniref:DNA-binding phage zinc finger domain-containing protein n=1 Tax=Streptantibioticus rubrisoli TaxID=1387313 RepID=A0ABT1PKB2_9ACTN|nr:hypothetical protein [Streptantibioticus rubrisoli]MCQ4045794.1 hypothetical protein [Streptantibioticus rubrisoli]
MPAAGVSSDAGVHSPSSARIPHPRTGVLPVFDAARVDLQELFLRLSPRLSLRVDTRSTDGKWLHKYVERSLPRTAPTRPYAVYLSSCWGRYRWLCFDLDDKRGDVGPDLATLLRWLEEAGITYVVAASGSAGGRHVWVAAETLLDSVLVASIAVAAAKRLPTLDYGLLKNRKGAARPIGAPHRNGGRSQLMFPQDSRTAAALLTPATCGNSSEAFTRLLLIIDAVPARVEIRPRIIGKDQFTEIIDDELGPRLAGTPNTVLDRETLAQLTRRPPEDRVSEVCGSVLTKLALRRWTFPMVERLLRERAYREGGLLHLCTSPGNGTLRVVLDADDVTEKLERQWARCVAYAATLPLTEESLAWTETIGDVVALVEQVQAAADACPKRWAKKSGPADRAALDLRCLLALRSGTTVLDLDVRRAALAVGSSSSAMHRAQHRLSLDGWLAARTSDGPAATHELLPVTASHPGFNLAAQGGTQGNPPPAGESRGTWISRLQRRLAAGQSDVFAYGRPNQSHAGGLGHHAGRVYQLLVEHAERPLSLSEMCEKSGYAPRTVTKHLARMRDLMVATRAVMTVHHECPTCQVAPGERCRTGTGSVLRRRGADQHAARGTLAAERSSTPHYRPRPGSLVAAAKALGTHGRLATRARWYAVEIELYRWWRQEEAWMRAPKAGIRTGVQTHDEQAALVLTTLPRQPRRRYPRGADGRGDHAAARARIERRIATA